ncbi:helix-turn-helix domain-containing protein [Clostridiisalibacter paucivorans]|uniref:helix-turn-helix domain-containing protein n=1 Tax=Clostridiisalibacter paucivorans TaxID=408753 RepID=UPI00047E3A6E|nr:helix-turn-helix domain-containing protein [Clostridiisalibacter paucivorans]
MNKAYRFRIYTNDVQKNLIESTFGCIRFVYNYVLNQRIETYRTERKSIGYINNKTSLYLRI